MDEFKKFADMFGLSPIVAIKFVRKGWWLINPKQLTKTNKGYSISLEDIKKKGLSFDDFIRQ